VRHGVWHQCIHSPTPMMRIACRCVLPLTLLIRLCHKFAHVNQLVTFACLVSSSHQINAFIEAQTIGTYVCGNVLIVTTEDVTRDGAVPARGLKEAREGQTPVNMNSKSAPVSVTRYEALTAQCGLTP
jgi:hypothetical protein